MSDLFTELSKLSPTTLSAIVALSGAFGVIASAIIAAIVGRLVVTPFLGARDKQDREVEWRKHAIELTKLDLERRLKARAAGKIAPLRPSILDFLANYRDLQDLGKLSPTDLYKKIEADRITHILPVMEPDASTALPILAGAAVKSLTVPASAISKRTNSRASSKRRRRSAPQ
ncbi:hypothetical protein [Mesorhizobium sp. B1-1-7]|uniref:hypothetical protein n=1 Tax=Mesorhizobium sp. B1-1-7 TaxID=2589977 RepID=UPI0011282F92|nr:hypothetical protein [Mesorhizobium sp. B1-1-7]TPN48565.1 hypothetical protein FJ978_19525 [Mesorhizobium sp. B1-1-7]